MSLPKPSSAFTIPSIHDDLELDCRVYYPRYCDNHFFGRTFAILAHPYATLGGCYDDPVVGLAGSTLLQNGVTVGTFNFRYAYPARNAYRILTYVRRGAGESAGRTSWTGRPELADYVSFYGFMICCISTLERDTGSNSPAKLQASRPPLLILGGYSYGSLIASCLPSYEFVAQLFSASEEDSAEAEIRSRAQMTARDLGAYFEMLRNGSLGRGRSSLRVSGAVSPTKRGIAMGGYDSEAASRRISRESSRKSLDGERVRRSLDRARQRIRSRVSSDQYATNPPTPPSPRRFEAKPFELLEPEVSYLAISPLLPPVSMLTTMFSRPTFEKRNPKTGHITARDKGDRNQKFLEHASCFIYGSKDVFTSDKKLRKWADEIHQKASATFSSYEVSEAGHFWTETEASARLQSSVKDWLVTMQRSRVISDGSPTDG